MSADSREFFIKDGNLKATEPFETSTPAAAQPSYSFEADELVESLFCPLDISDDSIPDVHEEESDVSHLNRYLNSRDMADKLSYNTICMWIPDLTRYRYKIAKRHSQMHGIGQSVPRPCQTRMRVPQEKLDHFICFITSRHIVQDLPFGEKKLTLSTNDVITVPNIIRSIVPERIVKQYQQYCLETNFSRLSRSTLL